VSACRLGVRTIARPTCYLCGNPGQLLYLGLTDRIADAPGSWNIRECIACDLLWLDPVPLAEDLGRAYEGYFTHAPVAAPCQSGLRRRYESAKRAYFAQQFGYFDSSLSITDHFFGWAISLAPTRRAYLDALIMHLSRPEQPSRVLDIGCGSGDTLSTLQSLGWDAEGIDFDPVVVENARNRGLRVHLGTVAEQHYPPAAFDAVIMSHVIEHVHDPGALLRECARILKQGGKLVVRTPNGSSWGHHHFGSAWLYLDPPRHLFLFSPAALLHLSKSAGFQDCIVRTSGRSAAVMYEGSRSVATTGRYAFGGSQRPAQRLWMEVVEFFACLHTSLRPCRGEELILVATT
jgi:SAM-dependent methyltransferase